jgi:hypothetical protein
MPRFRLRLPFLLLLLLPRTFGPTRYFVLTFNAAAVCWVVLWLAQDSEARHSTMIGARLALPLPCQRERRQPLHVMNCPPLDSVSFNTMATVLSML